MKIELTEREVNLILSCIDTNIETIKRRADGTKGEVIDLLQELAEIDMDIREQAFRIDGWDTATNPTFSVEEVHTTKRAMDPTERPKFASRAQERRSARVMNGTVTANISNDPVDW